MNIFVGNLNFATTEAELKQLFESFGIVASCVIVMSKDKKEPRSRGFGFVEMPDEAQAQLAISALNGKDFMGRVLNVSPSRPKTEAERESELLKKQELKDKKKAEQKIKQESEYKKTWVKAEYVSKPGRYKGGRRTTSYVKKYGPAAIKEGPSSWQKNKENPMRWRKRQDKPKPWKKAETESKPWRKPEVSFESKRRAPVEFKPWKKPEGESKPWRKPESGFRSGRSNSGESKPWQKPEAGFRPRRKSPGEPKPWRKPGSESSFHKSSEHAPKSNFGQSSSHAKPKGFAGRSRSKFHKKPGGFKR